MELNEQHVKAIGTVLEAVKAGHYVNLNGQDIIDVYNAIAVLVALQKQIRDDIAEKSRPPVINEVEQFKEPEQPPEDKKKNGTKRTHK